VSSRFSGQLAGLKGRRLTGDKSLEMIIQVIKHAFEAIFFPYFTACFSFIALGIAMPSIRHSEGAQFYCGLCHNAVGLTMLYVSRLHAHHWHAVLCRTWLSLHLRMPNHAPLQTDCSTVHYFTACCMHIVVPHVYTSAVMASLSITHSLQSN